MTTNPYESADPVLYSQVRPSYPAGAIEELLDLPAGASPSAPVTVADIGAGTGVLTRQLLEASTAVEVLAVEPSAAMRKRWQPNPRVTLVAGTSEATGLQGGSVDLAVWAQSFHWVDRDLTALELSRILRRGGSGAVLVNQMDVAEPWVHRLTRIMRSGDVIRKSWNPQLEGFRTSGPKVFRWEHVLTTDQVLELARTRSSYMRSSPHNRAKMQKNLRWYLLEHLGYETGDPVRIPHLTYLWTLGDGKGLHRAGLTGAAPR